MIPNRFGLGFHHLGLAVHDPQSAMAFLEPLGYRQGVGIFDPLQKVHVAMCLHPSMPDVELVWPGDDRSPIDRLLRRDSAAIYHFCYAAADAGASLAAMEHEGLDIVEVSPPQPALLFGGIDVSFYCISGFGLIEILHIGLASPETITVTAD